MAARPQTRRQAWIRSATHVDLHPAPPPARCVDLTALPQHLRIDLTRTALIVVDMQNDFCHPDGWLGSIGVDVSGPRAAIGPCLTVIETSRQAGVPVVWLNWGNRVDLANLPANVTHVYDPDGTGGGIGDRAGKSEAVLTRDSWGAAVVDELAIDPTDISVDKYRMSGFFDTELDSVLRVQGIDTLLFAGVNADQCVYATLTDAACLGYNVVLVEGASTTSSPQYCLDGAVYNTRQCFGFTATAEDLAAAVGASSP